MTRRMPEISGQTEYHVPGDYPVIRQRSHHHRVTVGVEKSKPLRSWGADIATAIGGTLLLCLLAFLLYAIS